MSVSAVQGRFDGQPAGVLRSALVIDILLGVTLVSLFTGIDGIIGPVKLQPFDFLALLSMLVIFGSQVRTPRASLPLTLLLLGNFIIYCVSAMSFQLFDGIKEAVQTGIVLGFAFTAFAYYTDRDVSRFLIVVVTLTLGVLAFNIVWHLENGYYVGWKRLDEPKTVFILLPLLLILVFERFPQLRRHSVPLVALAITGVIILLSGERKAYIFTVVTIIVWLGVLNWRVLLIGAVAIPILTYAITLDPSGYLNRQITSMMSADSHTFDESAILGGAQLDTLSNTQRAFVNHLAMSLWREHPIFGIGTNEFKRDLETDFQYVPAGLRYGIHGEFTRALVENGIVGLTVYAALWICTFGRILLSWRSISASGNSNLNKIKLLTVAMLLIYCSFEATKTLTVLAVCVLPYVALISPSRRYPEPVRAAPPVRYGPPVPKLERAP